MTFWNEIKLWTWFISDSLKSKLLVLVQSMSKSCHPCCQEALSNQQHMRYDCWWWIDEQDLHQLQKPEPILWETRNATWTKTGWKIPLIFRLRRSSNQRKTLENIFIIYEMLIYITVVCPKKPGFPLEVANGEMEKSLGPILENSLCLGCLLFVKKKQIQWYPTCFLLWIEEATEVMEDPNGRWFSFVRRGDSFVILEKKGLPTHLQSLECVDVAIKLQALVSDFEDQGEACVVHFFGLDVWVFFSNVYYKILSP